MTGLKKLGKVGTHIFCHSFFSEFFLRILKGISPFKMDKIIFFSRHEKN